MIGDREIMACTKHWTEFGVVGYGARRITQVHFLPQGEAKQEGLELHVSFVVTVARFVPNQGCESTYDAAELSFDESERVRHDVAVMVEGGSGEGVLAGSEEQSDTAHCFWLEEGE